MALLYRLYLVFGAPLAAQGTECVFAIVPKKTWLHRAATPDREGNGEPRTLRCYFRMIGDRNAQSTLRKFDDIPSPNVLKSGRRENSARH